MKNLTPKNLLQSVQIMSLLISNNQIVKKKETKLLKILNYMKKSLNKTIK